MATRKQHNTPPRNAKGRFTRGAGPFGAFADFSIDDLLGGGKKSRAAKGSRSTRTRNTRGSGW